MRGDLICSHTFVLDRRHRGDDAYWFQVQQGQDFESKASQVAAGASKAALADCRATGS